MNILIKRDDALMIVNSHDEQIGPKFGTVSDAQTWYAENRPDDEALSIGASVNNRTKTKPKSALTPGPWTLVKNGKDIDVYADGYGIATVLAGDVLVDPSLATDNDTAESEAELTANARLIALAPEMAEALKKIHQFWCCPAPKTIKEWSARCDVMADCVRALLARLEGGA